MPTRVISTLLPTRAELRQAVGELHPRELAARPRVVDRGGAVRIIETARGDIDFIRAVELEGDLRAAGGAEAARGFSARTKALRLAGELELRARHAEPCDERRAGRAPANGAMAIGLVERRAFGLVAHVPAKAATSEHRHASCGELSLAARAVTDEAFRLTRGDYIAYVAMAGLWSLTCVSLRNHLQKETHHEENRSRSSVGLCPVGVGL